MPDNVIDLAELKDRLDGDIDLFFDICEVFFEDMDQHISALDEGIKTNNAALVNEHAHALKGALANLSVKKASAVALLLEQAGRENQLLDAQDNLKNLKSEIKAFREFVDSASKENLW